MLVEDLEIMVMTREEYQRLWATLEEMQNLLWKVKRISEEFGEDED